MLTANEDGSPGREVHEWQMQVLRGGSKDPQPGEEFETHAYAFIHTDDIKARIAELFGENMQFDVIIGNPPTSWRTVGGGTSYPDLPPLRRAGEEARPTPANDGHSLPLVHGRQGARRVQRVDVSDDRLRSINDYIIMSDVFPGVALEGGVCYFLWDRDNPQSAGHDPLQGRAPFDPTRPLLEEGVDVFIRYNKGLSTLKKVVAVETGSTRVTVTARRQAF